MADGGKVIHSPAAPRSSSSAGVDVFVSYRRSDAADDLLWSLVAQDSGHSVFVDRRSVPAGRDLVEEITARIVECDAVVAPIGPQWLSDASGHHRLDDPEDFVRRELEAAFENVKPLFRS